MMVGGEIQLAKSLSEPQPGGVTAMVGLGGSPCGVFSVRCAWEVAEVVAGRMLGAEGGGLPHEQVCDALGEICNMVAGAMKSRLPDAGAGCMMSVPTVVRGSDYHVRCLTPDGGVHVALLCERSPIFFSLELQP